MKRGQERKARKGGEEERREREKRKRGEEGK